MSKIPLEWSNFRHFNKTLVFMDAVSYDESLKQASILEITGQLSALPLLRGTIQQVDEEIALKYGINANDDVLLEAYDDRGRVFVYPLEGQELMEHGKYAVIPQAIMAKFTNNTPLPTDIEALSNDINDSGQAMEYS